MTIPEDPRVEDVARRWIDPAAFLTVDERIAAQGLVYTLDPKNKQLREWMEREVADQENARSHALTKARAIISHLDGIKEGSGACSGAQDAGRGLAGLPGVDAVLDVLADAESALGHAAARYQGISKYLSGNGPLPAVDGAHEFTEKVLCGIATLKGRLIEAYPYPAPNQPPAPIEDLGGAR